MEMPFGSVGGGKVERDVGFARMVDVHQIAVELNVVLGSPTALDAGVCLLAFCEPFKHGHGLSGFERFEALERGSVFSRCKLDEEFAITLYIRVLSRFWHLRRDEINPRIGKDKTLTILEQRRVALYMIFAN